MLQSHWIERGVELRDVEPGPLPAGWVRLSVQACGVCGSDLHRLRNGPFTGTPGHEICGTILEKNIESPLEDRLYVPDPWVVCGHCDYCELGRRTHCRNVVLLGVSAAGGMASFVDVPVQNLYAANPALSSLQASITEPFAVCVRANHLGELRYDSRVLVLGGGTLGLISALLARDFAARVAVSVRHPHQAAAANAMGIEAVGERDVLAWGAQEQPDVIIEQVGGSSNTMDQAIAAAAPRARIVVVGLFAGRPGIDLRTVVSKELTILGSKAFSVIERVPEFRAAADLLPRFRREIELLQTHQFPLERVNEAFQVADDKASKSIKVTVVQSKK